MCFFFVFVCLLILLFFFFFFNDTATTEIYTLSLHDALPIGVLVDALIELGRYPEAGRVLQHMVDRKPDLAAYARVSYWRELHGDLAGARRAMVLAASAGGDTAENA